MNKREITHPPITRDRPDRGLLDNDVILVRDFTFDGCSMPPTYFLVFDAREQTAEGGLPYNLVCLPMGTIYPDLDKVEGFVGMKMLDNRVYVPKSCLIWYDNQKTGEQDMSANYYVKTDLAFAFDRSALNYEHKAEFLNEGTFSDLYTNDELAPKNGKLDVERLKELTTQSTDVLRTVITSVNENKRRYAEPDRNNNFDSKMHE